MFLGKQFTKLVGIYMPQVLHQQLKNIARKEGCSVSWLVVEALTAYLGVTQAELDQARGYKLEKYFKDRKDKAVPQEKESRR